MTIDAVPGVAPAEGTAVPEPSAPSNVVELPDGHRVILHPKVSIPLGIAARAVVRNKIATLIKNGRIIGNAEDVESALVEGTIAEVYLRLGISSWTFTDREGNPEPINAETIQRRLPFGAGGLTVAEAADALYSREIWPPSPLADQTSNSSKDMPTGDSMSLTNGTGRKRPTHSKRSSRNGTAGKRSGARGR